MEIVAAAIGVVSVFVTWVFCGFHDFEMLAGRFFTYVYTTFCLVTLVITVGDFFRAYFWYTAYIFD